VHWAGGGNMKKEKQGGRMILYTSLFGTMREAKFAVRFILVGM
jgi:hypothetical protein